MATTEIEKYLLDLFALATNGNQVSRDAGAELSKIAIGGSPIARDLVERMDKTLAGRGSAPQITQSEKSET